MDPTSLIFSALNKKPENLEILTKGYTNENFKFTIDEKKYVLKIFNNKNRFSEKLIIKSFNFPKVVVENELYRIEEFVNFDEVEYKNDIKEIIEAMRFFHSIIIKDVQTIDEIFKPFINGDMIAMTIYQSFKISDYSTLLHFDLLNSNMMKINGSIRFIDFEYSCYGPALCDIASLIEEASTDYNSVEFYNEKFEYSKEEVFFMITEYFQGKIVDLENIYNEVQKLRAVFMLLWFLWAVKISKLKVKDGFDFKLYGMAKLKRLRKFIGIGEREFNHLSKLL